MSKKTSQVRTKKRKEQAAASPSAQAGNNPAIRALVVKIAGEGSQSSEALDDPWTDVDGMPEILEPPFSPIGLLLMEEISSELASNLSTMEINIAGFGWRLKPQKAAEDKAKEDTAFATEVLAEQDRFSTLLRFSDYDEESFTDLLRRMIHEKESAGNAYWEILRDGKGDICAFRQMPTFTMRLMRLHPDVQRVTQKRPSLFGDGEPEEVFLDRRFRRFVQARFHEGGQKFKYFKEYGDPRRLHKETGIFQEGKGGEPVPDDKLATEVFHWKIPSTRSAYGIPRFIGAVLSVLGVRASEEINFITFKNNNIPSMVLLVSGGQVTDDTVDRISTFVEKNVQGHDNYSKFLVIEATADDEEGEGGQVRMELKPLTREQHTDALFQNYESNSTAKIRQSFRIPSLFLGRTGDIIRATAEISRRLTDEQVFAPERMTLDFRINRFMIDTGMLHHIFVSNTPNITSAFDLTGVMKAAERSGGMTPRVAHGFLQDILGQELPLPTGIDLDVPFSQSMAIAVKNQANPVEVGQQVTALKLLRKMFDEMYGDDVEDEFGQRLRALETAHG